ncbi:adhesive domain-containing protein [Enterococcus sp. CWB-B31]|uniref:adhesive domain-containing protein n=1 Tax=Enterococcus sp. CWB-B31 TaxID=2885159 RepID=UPI001E369198|nr:adhesive domain-containing protein [Enterococcus sp. CWB-B31]MCB5953697.1 WxL domain-containing protein [Enterococcus sp. CWB-B31]
MSVKGGRIRSSYKRFLSIKDLFVCSLVINLFVAGSFAGMLGYFFRSEEASAAVLDVEILSNLQTVNNSNTTPTVRWQPTVSNQAVDFTITGEALANVSVNLTGKKYGVLVIPPELANKVTARGQATVNTNVTVDISKVAVLTATLTAVNNLVNLLSDIQNGAIAPLTGVTLNLDEVNRQINLLNSVGSLSAAQFIQPMTLTDDGRALYFSLDDGLGPILANNVSTILTDLSNAVNALQATGTGLIGTASALTINTALAPVKLSVTSAIAAAKPLLTLGGTGVQQLADASALGNTTINMPTNVSGPGSITSNLDAEFTGTVIRSNLIDVNLLSTADAVSTIYFAGETFMLDQTLLPDSLNFGTHSIQTKLDETFAATQGGAAGGADTVGTIQVTDTRSTAKNWQVKVTRVGQLTNEAAALGAAKLKIYGGTLTSDFSSANVRSISGTTMDLSDNTQQEVMAVFGTSTTGTAKLEIPKFELFVPKNTDKQTGQYNTKLVWTVTESP